MTVRRQGGAVVSDWIVYPPRAAALPPVQVRASTERAALETATAARPGVTFLSAVPGWLRHVPGCPRDGATIGCAACEAAP